MERGAAVPVPVCVFLIGSVRDCRSRSFRVRSIVRAIRRQQAERGRSGSGDAVRGRSRSFGDGMVCALCLARVDEFSWDGFVGISGQRSGDGRSVGYLNARPGPAVMDFSSNLELQSGVVVLDVYPTASVGERPSKRRRLDENLAREIVQGTDCGSGLGCKHPGPVAGPTFQTVASGWRRGECGMEA
jgi:hypothetical protein